VVVEVGVVTRVLFGDESLAVFVARKQSRRRVERSAVESLGTSSAPANQQASSI
jgi:hypothetical protein